MALNPSLIGPHLGIGAILRASAKAKPTCGKTMYQDVLIDCKLACSFGSLNSESIKTLDDNLKVLIFTTVEALNKLPDKSSWHSIVECVEKNPYIEPVPNGDVTHTDNLVKKGVNAFKFDGSPDKTIVNEVESWFVKLVSDQDVLDVCNIDTKALADIVAQTGATVDSFESFFYKHEHHEATVLNVGVLRFPDIDHPYLKAHYIKLTAWSDCDRTLFIQNDSNGIRGVCHIKQFRPCEAEIKKMTSSVKQTAIKEAEAMFND